MSVLFSIIRIIPGKPCLLTFTYGCVAYCVVCWVTLVVMKAVQCASNTSWHHPPSGAPFCLIKTPIAVFQFTSKLVLCAYIHTHRCDPADCVAISILVVLPLRLLWGIKLPKCQRRMILCIFSSSIVLAFGALFHTLGQILNLSLVIVAGINAEVGRSLTWS